MDTVLGHSIQIVEVFINVIEDKAQDSIKKRSNNRKAIIQWKKL